MKTECLIDPVREKNEQQIKGPVLFCLNPGDANFFGGMAKKQGAKRRFIFNSNLWEMPPELGGFCLCGPSVGAPMAVLTLEKLIALGGQEFIAFGTCGSLSSDLEIGGILLPDSAVSEEGTSCHYPLKISPQPSRSICNALDKFMRSRNINSVSGTVWTTDAPYRETRQKVREFMQQGVLGVDMEFSALITVASFRKVELAALMIASDELHGDSWKPGFKQTEFKKNLATIRSILFEFLKEGHK